MAYEHKGEFQVGHGFGLPVKTTAEREAYIPNQEGYQVFDKDVQVAFVFANRGWIELSTAVETGEKVAIAGDTMTGELILYGDPITQLGATPRQFVEAQDALKVSKSGDTMTGNLVMNDDTSIGISFTDDEGNEIAGIDRTDDNLILSAGNDTFTMGSSFTELVTGTVTIKADTSEFFLDTAQMAVTVDTSTLVINPSQIVAKADTSELVLDPDKMTVDVSTSGVVLDETQMAVTVDTSVLALYPAQMTLDIGTAGVVVDPSFMVVKIDTSELVLGTDELTLDIGTSDCSDRSKVKWQLPLILQH